MAASRMRSSTSMATLPASFVGASPTNSIRQWTPNRPHDEPRGGITRVLISEHSHPGVQFRFEMESTGDAPASVPEETLMRVLCHLLIEYLPAEAIPDVWENVRDAWEWHSRPRLAANWQSRSVGPGVSVGAPISAPPFRFEEE